ncbi:uncharacterized protein LOC127863316 [Dreissena polymorpha]|uniref:uncharacterized protein LOC127863316 n=1 Tax=Dreissena polymorpha TaxID=45954 RepID=UPI002263CA15|nr:uncharacterized protein LOC127863316 [Dreissena polymorpha]
MSYCAILRCSVVAMCTKPGLDRATNSADCPVGFCCRDSGGNLINGEGFSELRPIENNPTVNGTCRRGPSKPDAVCTDRCGCTRGYTCYRTITGACCPPTTCWERKAAAKDKKFWENCKPPKCFFPPSANPGPLNGPVN